MRASDMDAASLTSAHQACCRKPVWRSTAARPWGAQSRHSVRLREASSDAHRHSAQQAHQTPSNPAKQAHIRPTNVGISSEVRSRPRRAYISAHLRAATPAVLGIHSVNKIVRRLFRSTPLGLHSIDPRGLLAQVVEHSTADRIVTGATPVRPFHFMPAACVTGTQDELETAGCFMVGSRELSVPRGQVLLLAVSVYTVHPAHGPRHDPVRCASPSWRG